ncbi:hypothetical protein ACFSCX_14745 [Bacillus salitolerans]|uniref:YuzL family protein n=1 Tax=Bacillus salitolerans TaxID=1437434 RepID=A0ABW4LRU1_9BACI
MAKNARGLDRPDDYKRYAGSNKGYNSQAGQVGNAIPQSEKPSRTSKQ